MRAESSTEHNTTPHVGSRLRRILWDGVLPEGIGILLVVIVLAGFVAAGWYSARQWRQLEHMQGQAYAQALAKTLAPALGTLTAGHEAPSTDLLKELVPTESVQTLRWVDPDGQVRLVWPPTALATPVPEVVGRAARRQGLFLASAPIRLPDGTNAGVLHLEVRPPQSGGFPSRALGGWGIAAAACLVLLGLMYRRLRQHLKPMAAVQRNLESYASGLEQELMALTLSDSLGTLAKAWNQLIEQLAELQTRPAGSEFDQEAQAVLTRFEGAVFRRMVERLPLGVLCLEGGQTITYLNASAAALLGGTQDELTGRTFDEVVPDPAVNQAVAGSRIRSRAGLAVDYTREEGDQEIALRFRVMPLSDETRGGDVMVTVEDIGYLLEEKRARDNFLYHVTHELRTPLTSIHAYAETLTKPGFEDEQTRKECYNVIISETRRLANLVNDILSVSQLEVGSVRMDAGEVDLLRLVRQMVQDNLAAADEKHIDLTLSVPPKVPKIQGDKQRLAVLLTNLIGNAIKYTPENGTVHVALETDEDVVRIRVSDTGIGIAPEDQAHVFDKFFRAADERVQNITGTGLGLALAREVARLHGGDIYLESEPGKGSTFTVELPLPVNSATEVGVP